MGTLERKSMKQEMSREIRMKPENEIGLVETPITDCSAVNDTYNLVLLQVVEIREITYYLFICPHSSMVEQLPCKQ